MKTLSIFLLTVLFTQFGFAAETALPTNETLWQPTIMDTRWKDIILPLSVQGDLNKLWNEMHDIALDNQRNARDVQMYEKQAAECAGGGKCNGEKRGEIERELRASRDALNTENAKIMARRESWDKLAASARSEQAASSSSSSAKSGATKGSSKKGSDSAAGTPAVVGGTADATGSTDNAGRPVTGAPVVGVPLSEVRAQSAQITAQAAMLSAMNAQQIAALDLAERSFDNEKFNLVLRKKFSNLMNDQVFCDAVKQCSDGKAKPSISPKKIDDMFSTRANPITPAADSTAK